MSTTSIIPGDNKAQHPKPLHGSGCLSKLVHPGSIPASSKLGGTTIGTDDPAVWQHILWFDGCVWAAELKSDLLRHVPTYDGLRDHFDRWKNSGQSPWMLVCLHLHRWW